MSAFIDVGVMFCNEKAAGTVASLACRDERLNCIGLGSRRQWIDGSWQLGMRTKTRSLYLCKIDMASLLYTHKTLVLNTLEIAVRDVAVHPQVCLAPPDALHVAATQA